MTSGGESGAPVRCICSNPGASIQCAACYPDLAEVPTCSHCGGVGHTIGAHF